MKKLIYLSNFESRMQLIALAGRTKGAGGPYAASAGRRFPTLDIMVALKLKLFRGSYATWGTSSTSKF